MPTRTSLTVTPDVLERAGLKAGVAPDVIPALWSELESAAPRHRFNAANVFFYFGAMVIISAMTWFLTTSWDQTNGVFKTVAALIYAGIFGGCSYLLNRRDGARVPAGLLATAAVCMTPLAVYGIESATNFWTQGTPGAYSGFYDYVKGSWILMELATIAVGLAAIRYVRFPFMVAPIAFALWYLSMDLAPLAFHKSDYSLLWNERATVSTAVGLLMIVAALVVDRMTREDYAFWLYFFGATSFWSGIWMRLDETNALLQFSTFVLGVVFIAASLVLGRRVLAVYGAFGCFGYLGHLAWQFQYELSFPVALSLMGLCVIGLGFLYQKNVAHIESAVDAAMPAGLKALIPRSRLT